MILVKYSSVLFLLSLVLLSCGRNDQISKEEMKRIVDNNNDILGRYFINGNADSLTSMYTKTAVVAPNGDDFYNGNDQILEMYKNDLPGYKILKMETKTLRIEGDRNVIYETGKTYLTINVDDSVYNTHVKYCNVWRLQKDGTYKLDIDIWNRDKIK